LGRLLPFVTGSYGSDAALQDRQLSANSATFAPSTPCWGLYRPK